MLEKRRYIFISRFYFSEPIYKIADDLRLSDSAIYKELGKIKSDLRALFLKEGVSI